MTHRGERSEKGKVRQFLRKIIWKTSYHDTIMAETICRINQAELRSCAPEGFAEIPNVEKGLVLSDSRGRGAFQ